MDSPPPARREALLVQITDTHLSASPAARLRGIDAARTLDAVIELAAPWLHAADHLVLTGDLTHDGSSEGARRLHTRLTPLGIPISHLPGNHDDPVTLASVFGGRSDGWPRLVSVKGWDLLLLNSCIADQEGGRIGGPQREHLAALLSSGDENRPALVALHHHPVPVGSAWMDAMALDDGAQLLELLARHPRARGVLFGHVHQTFDERIGSLRVLGSPSTCMQFEPHSRDSRSDHRLPGFRWLNLRDGGEIVSGVERLTAWPDHNPPVA